MIASKALTVLWTAMKSRPGAERRLKPAESVVSFASMLFSLKANGIP